MIGTGSPEQNAAEMKIVRYPSIIIVLSSIFCIPIAVIVLTTLPWLISQYNYLRGWPSPIDYAILTLLGPDLSRVVVLVSCAIGVLIGWYLSHFVTTKFDVLKKEREVRLSRGVYAFIIFWWTIPTLPATTFSWLELSIYGFPTSHFLSDLGFFLMAGYILAFSIPVLLKYGILSRYASSIDSKIILVEHHRGSGIKRRVQDLALRIVQERPNA